jgi:hypothetical protein
LRALWSFVLLQLIPLHSFAAFGLVEEFENFCYSSLVPTPTSLFYSDGALFGKISSHEVFKRSVQRGAESHHTTSIGSGPDG